MALIQLPQSLKAFAGDQTSIEVDAKTVLEALQALDKKFNGILIKILNKDLSTRSFVSVFVDSEDINFLQGIETPISPKSKVLILTALAGG